MFKRNIQKQQARRKHESILNKAIKRQNYIEQNYTATAKAESQQEEQKVGPVHQDNIEMLDESNSQQNLEEYQHSKPHTDQRNPQRSQQKREDTDGSESEENIITTSTKQITKKNIPSQRKEIKPRNLKGLATSAIKQMNTQQKATFLAKSENYDAPYKTWVQVNQEFDEAWLQQYNRDNPGLSQNEQRKQISEIWEQYFEFDSTQFSAYTKQFYLTATEETEKIKRLARQCSNKAIKILENQVKSATVESIVNAVADGASKLKAQYMNYYDTVGNYTAKDLKETVSQIQKHMQQQTNKMLRDLPDTEIIANIVSIKPEKIKTTLYTVTVNPKEALERTVRHAALQKKEICRKGNRQLLTLIYETVTDFSPANKISETRHQNSMKNSNMHTMKAMLELQELRGYIEKVDINDYNEGIVNKWFLKESLTEQEFPDEMSENKYTNKKLKRVDAILNMKGNGNNHIRLNKVALQVLRQEMLFLNEIKDPYIMILKAANYGMIEEGQLDVLNAFSNVTLTYQLSLYTIFRCGNDFYKYRKLPFGMSIATAVFTTYLGIHLQIMTGRYLQSLIPNSIKVPKKFRNNIPLMIRYQGTKQQKARYYNAVPKSLEVNDLIQVTRDKTVSPIQNLLDIVEQTACHPMADLHCLWYAPSKMRKTKDIQKYSKYWQHAEQVKLQALRQLKNQGWFNPVHHKTAMM